MTTLDTRPSAPETPPEPPRTRLVDAVLDSLERGISRLERWLIGDQHGLYGASFARILSGGAVLGILVTNFRQRDLLFGPGSIWNGVLQEQSQYLPPHLVAGMGSGLFLVFYLAVVACAIGWMLGWHTKLVGPLMLVGNVAIIERIPVLGDQGDNILRIGLFLLMFMNVSEVWSLDARRRARTEAVPVVRHGGAGDNVRAVVGNLYRSQAVVPRWLANPLHNLAFAALAFQLVLIYFSAGLFKAQGGLWQHGTAVYYPLQLQEYKPFPFLTDLLTYSGVVVNIATYLTVFAQLIFPVALLFHLLTRSYGIPGTAFVFRSVYVVIVGFHLSIAVVMALPWFALEMIAFDAIFVSSATYLAAQRWLATRGEGLRDLWYDVTDPLVIRWHRFRGAPTE
ncbi:MAG: hypothetical protein PGN07_07835 [Aeromicrobium erythreum]